MRKLRLETTFSLCKGGTSVVDDEIEQREQSKFRRRIVDAGIDESKTIARFDFAAAPRVKRMLINELSSCRFVDGGENVLLVGLTGTEKSHLAQGLGHKAIKRGYRVLYRPLHHLVGRLYASHADGTFHKVYTNILRVDVLILDDFGLVPLSTRGAEDVYEIIRNRYERKSIILTSNRAPEEWAEVFGNSLLASATLDRLTHHSQLIEMTGESYRQRQRRLDAVIPTTGEKEVIRDNPSEKKGGHM